MAEAAAPSQDDQITFNVKSSSDAKHVVTVPASMTVGDLKVKLSASEYADIPPARQRLIYSGRVLKDAETLASYKVKDGNTVHLVKGADSNARQDPANQGGAATGSNPTNPAANVPQNMNAGTGAHNPLAGLTGARYAGFNQLPGMDMFGADGGMGAPPDQASFLRMLDDPNFVQQMNEAMQNPDVLRMMQNSPMMRNNPMAQQFLSDPNLRRLIFDPSFIRAQMEMTRRMGGGAGGESFPAPGSTDTTPAGQQTGGTGAAAQNPFAGLGGANPFAAFGGGAGGLGNFGAPAGQGTTPAATPPVGSTGQGTPAQAGSPGAQNQQNPFANLANLMGGAGGQGAGGDSNPLAEMTRTMMQNPDMMRSVMNMMGGGGAAGGAAGGQDFSPFGFGGPFGGQQQQQLGQQQEQDTRPPEERYQDQLRQLNEMGFYEFERNVRALRMSGGSVQGAIEVLLGGTV